MSENTTTQDWKPGDVVLDSYGNPAVVLRVKDGQQLHLAGLPDTIMQTVGSDRGRITGTPFRLQRVTDEAAAEWAREVARSEWRNGRRW